MLQSYPTSQGWFVLAATPSVALSTRTSTDHDSHCQSQSTTPTLPLQAVSLSLAPDNAALHMATGSYAAAGDEIGNTKGGCACDGVTTGGCVTKYCPTLGTASLPCHGRSLNCRVLVAGGLQCVLSGISWLLWLLEVATGCYGNCAAAIA